MKVLEANSGLVTNPELLQILQKRSSQRASLGASLPVEQKACKYLLEQYPSTPTRDQVQAFSTAVKGFGLDRTNRLQLINISPTNLLELLLAIDNCEARFSSSQMEELLALVKKHLKA
ncbi:hypothetical protein ABBQ38_007230 [Trebouxia sp. C0009 RCD-2024]